MQNRRAIDENKNEKQKQTRVSSSFLNLFLFICRIFQIKKEAVSRTTKKDTVKNDTKAAKRSKSFAVSMINQRH